MGDDLKRLAKMVVNGRARRPKVYKDRATELRGGDILVVLHREELTVLEDVLCDALVYWDDTLSSEDKRNLLNILNHIQEGDK